MIRTAITDFRVKIIHLAVKQSDRAAQLNLKIPSFDKLSNLDKTRSGRRQKTGFLSKIVCRNPVSI